MGIASWLTPDVVTDTIRLLERMAPDAVNKPKILRYLREDMAPCELRTVVRAIAREDHPLRYLEIGVRSGWSMAQVADECWDCEIVGIDLWIPGYGGVPNPGAEWVRHEIKRVAPAHFAPVQLLTGNSTDVLPAVAGTFDLITVDGDHSGAGALADLRLCLPKVESGGYLVFDDLLDTSDVPGMTLREAWETVKREFTGFEWCEYDGQPPVGVAVRID